MNKTNEINDLPLVSFVIPTHNRADVLRDCLESVVNQTYKNIEVIVVNDNSRDDTKSILEEYKGKCTNFKYYNNNGVGGNAARNFGIQNANGEYIAFMDDDDICELDRIDEQMKPIIKGKHDFNFIVSAFSIFNSYGKVIEVIDFLKPMESLGFTVRWLIKKDLIIAAGGFDMKQTALQDVEFFWRLKNKAKIFYIKKPLIRVRDSQVSITKNPNRMIKAIIRLLELHSDKMSLREQNLWLIAICKNSSYANNWIEYKYFFKKIKKTKTPVTSLFLFLALLTKNIKVIRLHSKFYKKYEKAVSKLAILRPGFNYSTKI